MIPQFNGITNMLNEVKSTKPFRAKSIFETIKFVEEDCQLENTYVACNDLHILLYSMHLWSIKGIFITNH